MLIDMVQGQEISLDAATIGIQHHPEPSANGQTAFVAALPADLLLTTSLADMKQQLDRKIVHHSKDARLRTKKVQSLLVRRQAALQVCSVAQIVEQGVKVPFQPTIERPEVSALKGKQDPYRHQFTRIQLGLRMLANSLHGLINNTENRDDNHLGSHDLAPIWLRQPQLLRVS